MFLLDTNACIRLLNGSSPAVTARLGRENPAWVYLCSVVKAELVFGAEKSARRAENRHLLKNFFAPFPSLAFDDAAASHYAEIRAQLERLGTPIGPNDLLIAAIARTHDFRLVTHNRGEFSRVPGLRIEDWE